MKRAQKNTRQIVFDFLTLCHHNNEDFVSQHGIICDENGVMTKTHLLEKLEQHLFRIKNPLDYIVDDPRFELTETTVKLSDLGLQQTNNHFPLMPMP